MEKGAIGRIGEECSALGAKKVLLVTGSYTMAKSAAFTIVKKSIIDAGLELKVIGNIEPDPSIESVDNGAAIMREWQGDIVVALGGGSPMDAAKSICLLHTNPGSIRDYMRKTRPITRPATPLVCIPTTCRHRQRSQRRGCDNR